MTHDELKEAFARSAKLIDHMMSYVARMAPGNYAEFYADLNRHGIEAKRFKRSEVER